MVSAPVLPAVGRPPGVPDRPKRPGSTPSRDVRGALGQPEKPLFQSNPLGDPPSPSDPMAPLHVFGEFKEQSRLNDLGQDNIPLTSSVPPDAPRTLRLGKHEE